MEERREDDVNVWFWTVRLVDGGHGRGRQDDDGDVLRDGGLAVGWLEAGGVVCGEGGFRVDVVAEEGGIVLI